MQICKIVPEKLRPALELIWEVFEEFEVPDYEEMGFRLSAILLSIIIWWKKSIKAK